MAYVLGFFAADGYLTHNKRGADFWSIQITDLPLLRLIRKSVESDHKIGVRERPKNESTLYRLQIGSKEMCNDLRMLGFGERKTKTLAVPNVPERYFADFVRGYFDGDGNIWFGVIHKERKTSHLTLLTALTSCSEPFLRNIQERLNVSAHTTGSIIRSHAGTYFRLQYSKNDSLQLFNFMYNDSTLKLVRKYRQFKKRIAQCGGSSTG